MAWFKRFVDPIVLPDGRKLLTLRDAAEYITALPKAEHDAADWQVAMETLLLVAERDGPEMQARIGMMRGFGAAVHCATSARAVLIGHGRHFIRRFACSTIGKAENSARQLQKFNSRASPWRRRSIATCSGGNVSNDKRGANREGFPP